MEVPRLGPILPSQFRAEVMGLDTPVIVTGMLGGWGGSGWTAATFASTHAPDTVGTAMGRAAFRRRDAGGPPWETDCVHRDVSVGGFARWVTADTSSGPTEGWEDDFTADTHWGYISYARMPELFAAHPQMTDAAAVDWRSIGMEERFGADTNFWFGSSGAVTHLHYDTYGTNVVAQLYGTKKWTLFPPKAAFGLYSTRVPYEESSVFSDVNLVAPDPIRHPQYSEAIKSMWTATLGPGDVLFVPRHWWHHVEALTPSISVNRWVPDPEHDPTARVTEGLTRLLASGLREWAVDAGPSHWLNPTEDDMATNDVLHFLANAIDNVGSQGVRDVHRGNDGCSTAVTLPLLLQALTSPVVMAAWQDEIASRLRSVEPKGEE
jgi:HSPB1-associated protein 1